MGIVKAHPRKCKGGKTCMVKQHTRKGDKKSKAEAAAAYVAKLGKKRNAQLAGLKPGESRMADPADQARYDEVMAGIVAKQKKAPKGIPGYLTHYTDSLSKGKR